MIARSTPLPPHPTASSGTQAKVGRCSQAAGLARYHSSVQASFHPFCHTDMTVAPLAPKGLNNHRQFEIANLAVQMAA